MLTGFINEPRTWSSSSGIRCWELKVAEMNAGCPPIIYCLHFLPSYIILNVRDPCGKFKLLHLRKVKYKRKRVGGTREKRK